VVYLPDSGSAELDLETNSIPFRVQWSNPRAGRPLEQGPLTRVAGPGKVLVSHPPSEQAEDRALLIRK